MFTSGNPSSLGKTVPTRVCGIISDVDGYNAAVLAPPLSGVARLRALGPATKGCGGKWAGDFACPSDLRLFGINS